MKIAIGCDHGGMKLKPELLTHLQKRGIEYVDFGCYTSESVDYNDYAILACQAVANKECDLGILICGTGIGMAMVANKIKGIRCGHCHDVFSARQTRMHNDANVLAFGERVVGVGLMKEIVDAFLDSSFVNEERHVRRVNKIIELEQKNFK